MSVSQNYAAVGIGMCPPPAISYPSLLSLIVLRSSSSESSLNLGLPNSAATSCGTKRWRDIAWSPLRELQCQRACMIRYVRRVFDLVRAAFSRPSRCVDVEGRKVYRGPTRWTSRRKRLEFVSAATPGLFSTSMRYVTLLRTRPASSLITRSLHHGYSRRLTVLALESSADDTCAAVVTSDRKILSNVVINQQALYVRFMTWKWVRFLTRELVLRNMAGYTPLSRCTRTSATWQVLASPRRYLPFISPRVARSGSESVEGGEP